MNGTFYSTRGLRRITRRASVYNLRLVVFAVAVALGVLLLLWIQANVGRRMAQLQQEFGAIQAEGFYVGVHMRVHFRKLNETLLSLHLRSTATGREGFLAEARDLKAWLVKREDTLTTNTQERACFDQMEAAYDRYLTQAEQLLEVQDVKAARASFANTYEKLQESSQPVMECVAQLVQAQTAAFDVFLQDSQRTLAGLQHLLHLSLVLLLTAVSALAFLVYRGLIAPLRRRLTESRALIERQEKLAALGTLAAGVAHELRNPLTAIRFRLFSLRKSLPPEWADNEDASTIDTEISRLDRIVKDFLKFARPSEPHLVRVLAEHIAEEVRDLMKGELGKSGIQLKLETAAAHWVHADPSQLKQVLINLIQNAADSIGRNGTIILRVQPGTERLSQRLQPVVLLQVADTGQGIPPEVQKRLFDPFFSTKEGGTGLGLAIAARIVEKHGGLLRHQTALNRGTTFDIVLPRLDDDASPTPHHRG